VDINLGTPALLFPAISLVMLAYTTRFHALAALIRQLLETHRAMPDPTLYAQITALRMRVRLILWMQGFGVLSFTVCVVAMIVLLMRLEGLGTVLFASSLVLLLVSLLLSILEIRVSANALDVALRKLEP
jgi:Protein of unknown function (DUF2721)